MRILALGLAAGCLMAQEAPVPATDQRVTGIVEAGYRWRTDPGGSVNTYRSVVDLGSGPKLLRSELTILDPHLGLFDRIETRSSNWGDDPYSTLHVSATKQHFYDFTAEYSNIAYFNYLPSFADPLLGRGTVLNQRSFDVRRRMANLQLELLPGNWFVPYLAYERSSGQGHGISTFVSDANEYPVATLGGDGQNQYRGGVRFQLQRVNLTIEQGGTTFKDDQSLFENVNNHGNRNTPFLGQTLTLNSLIQANGIRSDSVHTRVSGTGSPTHWLNLSGDFLYSRPRAQSNFQQANTGNFVLSKEALAFTAQQYLLSSEARMPRNTGTFGAELLAHRRTRIMLSFVTDRLDNHGSSAAENTLISGIALPTRLSALTSSLRNEYNHLAADVMFDVIARLSIRAGYRYAWGENQASVIPQQGLATLNDGRLRRKIASGGFSFRPFSGLTLNADVEGAASARTYFRTSLNDYQRGGVRARYQVAKDIHLTSDLRMLNSQNPTLGINYDFRSTRTSVALQWNPAGGKRFGIQADYSRSDLRSDIAYLIPQTLRPDRSVYREYAHNAGALVDVVLPHRGHLAPKLSFGGSLLRSGGTRPTSYYQPLGSLFVPIHKELAWVCSWRYYGFGQTPNAFEAFRTHLIETGLRFSR